MVAFQPLFVPVPGGMELVVILMLAVLLFGANKIPELARSTGQAMGEFQKGRQEMEEEIQENIDTDVDNGFEDGFEDDSDARTESETATTQTSD